MTLGCYHHTDAQVSQYIPCKIYWCIKVIIKLGSWAFATIFAVNIQRRQLCKGMRSCT
jgi:hypothetical protein